MIGQAVTLTGQSLRHRTETVYDALGRVHQERTNIRQLADGTIDASQVRVTTYEYDELGNLIKTTFPDATFISASYDALGRKVAETNQLGQSRTFEYDAQDRLIAVNLPQVLDPATSQMASPRYEYAYDARGNHTLIRDPLGRETRFIYDARGNQLSRTLPLGFGPDGRLGTADDSTLPEGAFKEEFE